MSKLQKGNPGGRGRRRGTKAGATVTKMALEALDKLGGVAYLVKQGKANPAAFLAFLGKTTAKDINIADDRTIDELLVEMAKKGQ